MDPEQKKLLEPFAEVIFNWAIKLRAMEPEEFAELEKACQAATDTNCWCS